MDEILLEKYIFNIRGEDNDVQQRCLAFMFQFWQDSDDDEPMPNLTYSQLNNRRMKAGSREKFAWTLFHCDFFTKKQRGNRNINGTGGKKAFNKRKLALIRKHTFRFFPVSPPMDKQKEDQAWKLCLSKVNKNNK